MQPSAFVYVLANLQNTTFYVGVTTAIRIRVWEHKTKQNPASFTARYNVDKLVYFEGFDTVLDAIHREKYIKGKSRAWKIELIKSVNPDFKELTPPAD
jgi:putative endonuclease